MKNKKPLIFLILILFSCSNPNKTELDWLLGDWKTPMNGSWYYESWEKTADGELLGSAYILYKDDTTFSEKMHIFYRNGRWNYKNSVNGQSSKVFLADLDGLATDSIVFRNPAEEFPGTITYIKSLPTLKEKIEGMESGSFVSFPMELERIK